MNMEFLIVWGIMFFCFYNIIKIMGRMFWRNDLGDIVEVPKEQQDRIKEIGYSRNMVNRRDWEAAAENAVIKAKLMEEEAREMLMREIRAVKNGEMRVVEVKADPAGYPEEAPAVKEHVTIASPRAEAPEPKTDRIGYQPDFYTP